MRNCEYRINLKHKGERGNSGDEAAASILPRRLTMSRKLLATVIAALALAVFVLPTVSFAQGPVPAPDTNYSGDFQLQGR